MPAQINPAQLSWNAQGNPVSEQFDDVYFSNDNGLEETRYVFLQNNHLPARWSGFVRSRFVVAESGFGTGLNFLACWQAFRRFRRAHPQQPLQRLHFISFEKFPLAQDDLAKALAAWPEISDLAAELIRHYPQPLDGCHRMRFEQGEVVLDLWFGDIHDSLRQLVAQPEGEIDCWFLDGFAPGKNPQMWTQPLFDRMVRLARAGATFATFTAAGLVRRGLQEAGFTVEKCKGYGTKREMLRGRLENKVACRPAAPWYHRPASPGREVTVIGAGLAGAASALALVRRGKAVRLVSEGAAPADGASGNRQGALYPLLNGSHNELSRFYAAAFGFARREIDALLDAGHAIAHDWCGVLQLDYNEAQRTKLTSVSDNPAFPAALVQRVDVTAASRLAGLTVPCGGLFYPAGGWLCPADLTRAMLAEAARLGELECHYNCPIQALERSAAGWLLHRAGGASPLTAQTVVVAAGHQSPAFAQLARLPLYSVRGQVSHLPSQGPLADLQTVLCYEGYLTPADRGQHCIGASYGRNQITLAPREEDQQENLARLRRSLAPSEWPLALPEPSGQRVGIRCASRDHLPMIGQVPDLDAIQTAYAGLPRAPEAAWPLAPGYAGLYLLGALGSRGVCSAMLAAELLAGQLDGELLPLPGPLLDALNPNRLWIRKLLKGKPLALGV